MGAEVAQGSNHQEQEELSEGEEVRQENRSMKQEDYERAVIIQTRIDQCNYILDMIEKNKAIRIAQGNRSMTIQDPTLVDRIIKDIKEHRENLQCDFELLGE
jgi:2,4-dienoyl-CoA reductase-like NADH-dependent reductase (Old Yellow Enzyme family)